MSRISKRFTALKADHKSAFIPFISAGDPDLITFAALLKKLPAAGADLIEIGMPFSDPVADGPAIERANLRAFAAGISLKKILKLVEEFRAEDLETPIILMGYANPIFAYGVSSFTSDAQKAGVDGLIIADLPPEEDSELRVAAKKQGIDIIRLVTPTTDADRLRVVLDGASGFLYYVSVTGITGSKEVDVKPVAHAVQSIHTHSSLPVAVGFGISTAQHARQVAACADAVVVGSAIVNRIASNLDTEGRAKPALLEDVLSFVETLAFATHTK